MNLDSVQSKSQLPVSDGIFAHFTWDWDHVPFLAFLRIPSSGGVLPEQSDLCFVGEVIGLPLRQ
jgi:hypothetical protein